MTAKRETILGKAIDGKPVSIDVDRLIESRMLLTANSGGGKSWALRRLLEQTHGAVQQLVLDPEGEFFTLREHFDYVLAGKGGDCPAEPRSAAMLAKRMLELRTSAIMDLYELKPAERVRFVRLFLEALNDAPRDLWHPVLVVIDEAHKFAPEQGHGSAESSDAVAQLMAAGRKKGQCGVLATQRLSKLSKDAAAEANNLLIGRTVLDLDVARAGASLGMTKSQGFERLQPLKPGTFFAFGPALVDLVTEVKVGDVRTSHPEAGEHAPKPPPPRERVRKILAQLADLPAEAEAEAKTIDEARARIKQLERELIAAKKTAPEAKVERVEVPILSEKAQKHLESICDKTDILSQRIELQLKVLGEAAAGLRAILSPLSAAAAKPSRNWPDQLVMRKLPAKTMRAVAREIREHPGRITSVPRASVEGVDAALTGPERKLLTALAQHGRMSKTKLAVLTGYSQQGGGFRNPLGRLRTREFVEYLGGDDVQATDLGIQELGEFEPLPTGTALLEQWLGQLSGPESKILRALADAYPKALDAETLAERTGYAADGGGFRNPLGRLRTLELVTRGQEIRASDALFGDGQ